jgi:hypothetical protein
LSPLALFAAVFLISKLDAHRLEVFARGLSVLLDHGSRG